MIGAIGNLKNINKIKNKFFGKKVQINFLFFSLLLYV